MPIDILRAFTDAPKPLDFVLPGLLAGTVGSFVSPKNVNKSMLALELALLVSTGFDLSGLGCAMDITVGKTAFFSSQDHDDEICRKLYALGNFLDQDLIHKFSSQCEINSFSSSEEKFQKYWFSSIESMSVGRRLLFLDTTFMSRLFEKNNNVESELFLIRLESIARKSGCAIVVMENSERSFDTISDRCESEVKEFESSLLIQNIVWQIYLEVADKIASRYYRPLMKPDENPGITFGKEIENLFFMKSGFSKHNQEHHLKDLKSSMYLRCTENGVLVPAKKDQS